MNLEKNTLDASSAIFIFLSAWLYLNVVISIAKNNPTACLVQSLDHHYMIYSCS